MNGSHSAPCSCSEELPDRVFKPDLFPLIRFLSLLSDSVPPGSARFPPVLPGEAPACSGCSSGSSSAARRVAPGRFPVSVRLQGDGVRLQAHPPPVLRVPHTPKAVEPRRQRAASVSRSIS
ncbi:unnamed protein product [Pleuronectes platessa]|uniref:Uncharacterized protein n=1 Tax=Pleuronectes platessa TaxID=8262 RepID=A0A9N7U8V4_PLEPL|nr:unnamed protein product [Pleuronectes platessa]